MTNKNPFNVVNIIKGISLDTNTIITETFFTPCVLDKRELLKMAQNLNLKNQGLKVSSRRKSKSGV